MTKETKGINRGEQLAKLRKLAIAAYVFRNGEKVSGAAMKAVLRTIDDHGAKCWASSTTIAAETCLCEKTVRRALKALEAKSLVGSAARPGLTSVYQINWQAVATPDTTTGVTPQTTPDSMSGTPDTMSTTPDSMSAHPGHSVRRSVKKRNRTEKKRDSLSALRFDEADLAFAESMFAKVLQVVPKTKKPNLPKWANEVRLMREVDEHSLAEIRTVFQWANSNWFWATNIRSPSKLREKFAELHAKMSRGGSTPGGARQVNTESAAFHEGTTNVRF